MKASRWIALAVVALGVPLAARADIAQLQLSMQYHGQVGKTAMLRADLTGFDSGSIDTVTIADDPNWEPSTGEIFSGFDLDCVFFDRDGDLATDNDRIFPLGKPFVDVTPGVARPFPGGGGPYCPPYPGPLFGLEADGSLNEATATLHLRDGAPDFTNPPASVVNSHGWVSLGDGGVILLGFPQISISAQESMFLFVGEVGPPGTGLPPDELAENLLYVQLFLGADFVPVIGGPGRWELASGQWVNLDGNTAADPQTVSWLWDLDGDGEYDDAIGAVQAISFEALFSPMIGLGDYTVWLQTTGTGGQQEHPFTLSLIPEPASLGLLVAALPWIVRRRRKG
ncbi:MAG TPA: PEP-CTERM sorting domain-containing protein [Phycisphaerae bacterium]|nr:PEP-CTERM sorting domain-containing protein [Phycisphaerae bacterium]